MAIDLEVSADTLLGAAKYTIFALVGTGALGLMFPALWNPALTAAITAAFGAMGFLGAQTK